jgi:hypothetical protein
MNARDVSLNTDAASAATLLWYLETFERFCALLNIRLKDGSSAPFKLNRIQKLYLRNKTQRDVILKPRQVGMTTLLLAYDIWKFLTVRGAHVVIVCQSQADNGPLNDVCVTLRRFFASIEAAGLKLNLSTERNNEWAIEDRSARLRVTVSGASEAAAIKKGRGGTITRLHCTETAVWEFAEETLNALLESIGGVQFGTEIVSESTANGAAGYFYKLCKSASAGQSSYRAHFYPWFEQDEYAIPLERGEKIEPVTDRELALVAIGVKPEQLKWYRSKVAENGQDRTDQEYPSDPETCFLVSGRCFFEQSVTTALLTKCTAPIETREQGRIRIYKKPESDQDYLIAADTSEGTEDGDSSGALVYHWRTGEHVATIDGKYQPHDLARVLVTLGKEYNTALVAVERNNHGHAALLELERHLRYPYAKIYRSYKDKKPGWNTTGETRPVMLDGLEDAHRKGLWTSPDSRVLSQMRTFIVNDNGKAEAAKGEHDDLVIPAALGWEIRQKPKFQYSGAPASVAMM